MRVSDLISLGLDCLLPAALFALVFGFLFLVGYRLLYKKVFKGTKTLTVSYAILFAVFLCYVFMVLGVTLLHRGASPYIWFRLTPFYSYIEAWHQFKAADWRNIILNIFLFVPFGLMLPFLCKKCEKMWVTALSGFGFTLLIELIQLIAKVGIFETDDLMNNTMGTLIGYGFYKLACYIHSLMKKVPSAQVSENGQSEKTLEKATQTKTSLGQTLAYQIPLAITILTFGTVFIIYNTKELGNLSCHYVTRGDTQNVILETTLDETPEDVFIYTIPSVAETEAREYARNFFQKLGTALDENYIDLYDESVYYSNTDGSLRLIVTFQGVEKKYIDFDAMPYTADVKPKSDAAAEELISAIGALGFYIPKTSEFVNLGNGEYRFRCDCLTENGIVYDGAVTCELNEEGRISQLDYDIKICTPYRETTVISEAEAYQNLCDGRFRFEPAFAPEEIVVTDIFLTYSTDSKGFYQPVYAVNCNIDGESTRIYLPAIK